MLRILSDPSKETEGAAVRAGRRAPSSVDNGNLRNVGANSEVTGNTGVFGAPRRPGWHVKKMGERVD